MKLSQKNIGIIAAAIVVLLGGYWYFFTGSSSSGTDVPLSATPAASAQETRFLELTNQLNPIAFDTSLFSDPRFALLVDLSTNVTPEPAGRTDPFAPISGLGK